MDPATIGLLISIAPTVLELLFGRGNIIKHEMLLENPKGNQRLRSKNKMYGYGLEGYGYRYPGRKRKVTVATYYPEEDKPELIKAAVFNRAIAAKNPWIQHLRKEKVYDGIRELLEKARKTYKPPAKTDKQKRALATQLTRLQAQLDILKDEEQKKSLFDEYKGKFGGDDKAYEAIIKEKMNKLQKEIDNLKNFLT
jgi:hypothetical protein